MGVLLLPHFTGEARQDEHRPSFGIRELGEEREWGPRRSQERKDGDLRLREARGVVCRPAPVGV